MACLVLGLAACATHDGSDLPERARGDPPTVYTVERGDTLYSISWRYGLAYRQVAAWNNIGPPYTIYPGQKLRLKPPVEDSPAAPRQDNERAADRGKPDKAASARGSKRAASGYDWQWPADGSVVSGYGTSDYGKKGISVGGEADGPVYAAAAGHVVYSGNGLRGYGNLVIVKHDDTYLTAYGYNAELLVREGDNVERGARIARMGKTPGGQVAVHFELRRDGQPVNPLHYLPIR
jgi:lipoprotein NlpD